MIPKIIYKFDPVSNLLLPQLNPVYLEHLESLTTDNLKFVMSGPTSLTLANNTLYAFTESPPELSISLPENWWFNNLAHITFMSGSTATSVTFNAGILANGSIEPNSMVEISILGGVALISSVPFPNTEADE